MNNLVCHLASAETRAGISVSRRTKNVVDSNEHEWRGTGIAPEGVRLKLASGVLPLTHPGPDVDCGRPIETHAARHDGGPWGSVLAPFQERCK